MTPCKAEQPRRGMELLSGRTLIAVFGLLTILKPHDEKYLNSCEGKEYATRKLNLLYIYSSKAKAFIERFSESGFKFLKSLCLIFVFLLGKKMLEENGVSCS